MKSFLVPITRTEGPRLELPSDTDVIVCPENVRETHRVERERFKSHKSVDEYLVHKAHVFGDGDYVWLRTTLTKLGRVKPETPILVKLDPQRPQRCHFQGGHYHALKTWVFSQTDDDSFLTYICGDYYYKRGAVIAEDTVPTCPDCLEDVWFPFAVAEYERPEVVRKIQNKEAAERKFRANLPTRFERIDDEEPKSDEVPVIVDTEPDLDEPAGREAKLGARVRHAKHVEAAIIQKRCK